jgi:Outer membrane protein beta-barrel domain
MKWSPFTNTSKNSIMPVSKKLVLVILAGISFATANAQVQIGVKAGANFTTLTDDMGYSARTLFNFNAGAFAQFPLGHFVSLQPELVYSGQGARYVDGDGYIGSQHLNYLNIPVLLKLKSRYGVYVETGLQVGFLTSAKDKDQGSSADISSQVSSADFSWVFGFGYKVPMSPVGIDFRYNLGLSNIDNNNVSGDNYTLRNDVFQLGLTYVLFSAGRR